MSLGSTAVVGQRTQLWVDGVRGVAYDVAVDLVGDAGRAGSVANQVVPVAGKRTGQVRTRAVESHQVQRDESIPKTERTAGETDQAAAGEQGGVLNHGAIH